MAGMLFVCALLAGWSTVAPAQPANKSKETVVRLTVHPAAAPRPALRYLLLPELREMTPGNAVQGYLSCFMEQQNFFFNADAVAKREKWQTLPLQDLPLDQLKAFGYDGSSGALRRADYAARLDHADWQVLPKIRAEGFALLLPEVQQFRMLAAALKVQLRYQVGRGDFEGALRTAKTMFALARHQGEHPSLIGALVGMAIEHLALGPLEELIEQPGSPNLYWALTDLPTPYISLRPATQGERLALAVEFADLDSRRPMAETRLQKVVQRLNAMIRQADPALDVPAWLEARARDEGHVRAARARLVADGMEERRVREFPALQVVLLDEKRALDEAWDEAVKWLAVPYWKGGPPEPKDRTSLAAISRTFLPPLTKVRQAQNRLEQRLALLRHVEALRLYAASHAGRLPARLGDVSVPLPDDPFTGKPFHYEVNGATAVLKGSPPQGEENNPIYNLRYEVTLQK